MTNFDDGFKRAFIFTSDPDTQRHPMSYFEMANKLSKTALRQYNEECYLRLGARP